MTKSLQINKNKNTIERSSFMTKSLQKNKNKIPLKDPVL
jgi:hypothetical protein